MNRHNLTDDFHERTIVVWQPHSDRALTHEDAREIIENLVGFFHLLVGWDAKERADSNSATNRAKVDENRCAT